MATESVCEYASPPRIEPTSKQIVVIFNGVTLADTRRALRVLETNHPPVYYLPPEDIRMEYLAGTERASVCEWKGRAAYYTVRVGNRAAFDAAWTYPRPETGFEAIASYVAFYPTPMDACIVDGERVLPQPGGFYGGWITSDIRGPFKGQSA